VGFSRAGKKVIRYIIHCSEDKDDSPDVFGSISENYDDYDYYDGGKSYYNGGGVDTTGAWGDFSPSCEYFINRFLLNRILKQEICCRL
jgi:hypothetical protein